MIYLDVNVFVYAFLRTDEVGNKSRALLDKVVKGHLPAITSYLTFDEFFWNVNKLSAKETTLSYTQNLLQTPNLTFVAIDTEIISKAYELLKTYNLGPRDAIHAATAILSGATIVSEDNDFNQIKELKQKKLKDVKNHQLKQVA